MNTNLQPSVSPEEEALIQSVKEWLKGKQEKWEETPFKNSHVATNTDHFFEKASVILLFKLVNTNYSQTAAAIYRITGPQHQIPKPGYFVALGDSFGATYRSTGSTDWTEITEDTIIVLPSEIRVKSGDKVHFLWVKDREKLGKP